MWVARVKDGILLAGLTRLCVDTLRGVPMLLESNDERVRSRLLPETYDCHDSELSWRDLAVPELERLFASRTSLVRRDLDQLRQIAEAESWVLLIPDRHANAWLSCLNAARLALYLLNDLTPEMMERDGLLLASPKQQEALLRIHFLAEVQCVLMGDVEYEQLDVVEEGDDGEPRRGTEPRTDGVDG
jgi:hypothetical protein